MRETLPQLQRGAQPLPGQFPLTQAKMRDPAEMQPVGLPPRILALGRFGPVESIPGILQRLARFGRGEISLGERDAEIDGEFAEAAGVGEQDASFTFSDGLSEVAEMALKFRGGVEATELEFNVAGAAGEGAGALEVRRGAGGIVGKEKSSE